MNTSAPQALPIDVAWQQALSHHQAGRLSAAENLYRAILQAQPNHPDANHNLGVVAVQSRQTQASLPFFQNAIAANPSVPQYWISYISALISTHQLDLARQALAQSKANGLSEEQFRGLMKQIESAPRPTPHAASHAPSPQEIDTLLNLFQQGHYGQAATQAETLTQRYPQDSFAWKALGVSLLQLGQSSQALAPMQKAAELSPTDAEVHANLGNVLRSLGQLNAAKGCYLRALDINPQFVEALTNLGLTSQELGLPQEAEHCYRRALALKPDFVEAHYNLGLALHSMARLTEAETCYRAALKMRPDLAKAHLNIGVIHQDSGHLDEAETAYRQALECKPDFSDAYCNLGVILQKKHRHAEAETCHRQAIALNPNFAPAHNNLGTTLQALQRFGAAEACFRTALSIRADFLEAQSNLANLLLELGRLDEAEANYRQALEIDPNSANAHCQLAVTLQNMARFQEAESSYRRALALEPELAEAHLNIGVMHQNQDRLDAAEACYRQALQFKPDSADAHCNLGAVLQKRRRFEEAEISIRQAIALNPQLAQAHNNLATILQARYRFDEAEASFRTALAIKPDFLEAQYNLANLLIELSRLDEAEAGHRRVLETNPDFAGAHYNLGVLLQAQERFDEAEASYQQAQKLGSHNARIRAALMLPAIMGTQQEVIERRAAYERKLDQLIADNIPFDDPLKNGWHSNFYLAYHGMNDRDLQAKVAKFYVQTCPSLLYVSPHCVDGKLRASADRPIRIGFLSRHLHKHSVSLSYGKIVEALSLKEEFDVSLIGNRPVDASVYPNFNGTRLCVPEDLSQAREDIAALELDALIYLDVGMEPFSYFMAFARLAPIQCVLGGHPVTTGIPNIDYYLSADHVEPADAQDHYSEKLIRLISPIFHFERPALPARFKSRAEMGLPENRHLYLCPMKLQKMHPDFDEAVRRILQIDPNGVAVFFEDHKFPSWKTALIARFEKTIPLSLHERILFLPWISDPDDFLSVNVLADVILDPFHFGIGSTIIAAFAVRTPIVTKPGEFLRGRVGYGFCKMMDLDECIAHSVDEFAHIAVNIASSPSLRETIQAKIRANDHRLFNNLQPVEELADFIRDCLRS